MILWILLLLLLYHKKNLMASGNAASSFLVYKSSHVTFGVLWLRHKTKSQKGKEKMKKAVTTILAVMVVLAFGASVFAAGDRASLWSRKQEAVSYAGLRMEEVTFTKVYQG